MAFDPYASGVLSPEHHDRLVANIAAYAKDAGIAPRWMWTKMSEVCGPAELDYARKFPHHRIEGKVQGLVYFRKTPDADPETHMAALAGCLVRNFCRARVMELGTVLDYLADGGHVAATCLLVPDFAPWQSQAICELLAQRGREGLQTVIYATDADAISGRYGLAARRVIETCFLKTEI